MGEKNRFFGKTHTEKVKTLISQTHKGKTGPKKGVFTHTAEARKAISKAGRERWKKNRDLMLSYSNRGENLPRDLLHEGPKYRSKFTEVQKREWISKECFYCGSAAELVLDHIIPISCGGKNVKSNAQTLCEPCNRWKMRFVDTPMYFATIGKERG